MNRTVSGWVVAGTLVLSGAAAAQPATTPAPATTAAPVAGPKAGESESNGWIVPTDEKAFLARAHHMNLSEIESATVAQQNATSQQVKDYATMLVTEHQKTVEQLKAYATTKKITLSAAEPKPANAMERAAQAAKKAELAKLKTLKGPAFDQTFLAAQVSMHDAAIGKHQAAAKAFTTGELNTLITQMLPHLQQHRAQAYQLLGQAAGTTANAMGAAGTRSGSTNAGSLNTVGTGSLGSTGAAATPHATTPAAKH